MESADMKDAYWFEMTVIRHVCYLLLQVRTVKEWTRIHFQDWAQGWADFIHFHEDLTGLTQASLIAVEGIRNLNLSFLEV